MAETSRKAVMEKFAHLLTGFVVVLKGIDKAEHFHDHPVIAVLLIALGIIILVSTFFHHEIEKYARVFKSYLCILEGIALFIVSYYYFSEGKKALPTVYLLCSIAYFVAAYIIYQKKVRSLQRPH